MNVNPGSLKKRIEIYKLSEAEDADGYFSEPMTLIHSCRANFKRMSGTEVHKEKADFTDIDARFLIRFTRTLIDRKMIVKYNGNNYEIKYVNNYNDSCEYIEIWASLHTTGRAI